MRVSPPLFINLNFAVREIHTHIPRYGSTWSSIHWRCSEKKRCHTHRWSGEFVGGWRLMHTKCIASLVCRQSVWVRFICPHTRCDNYSMDTAQKPSTDNVGQLHRVRCIRINIIVHITHILSDLVGGREGGVCCCNCLACRMEWDYSKTHKHGNCIHHWTRGPRLQRSTGT